MKNKFIFLFLILLLLPSIAFADNLSNAFEVGGNLDTVVGDSGYQTGIDYKTVVGTVIQILLSLIGVFFLVLMIYGGFLWMTDRGNSDQVEKAKKLITAAIIGMIIVLASYAISYFVINAISTPTLKTT